MKLLCSVGYTNSPPASPRQNKLWPPFLEVKRKELNYILIITISVGYFYLDVLMFLLVLFHCTEI